MITTLILRLAVAAALWVPSVPFAPTIMAPPVRLQAAQVVDDLDTVFASRAATDLKAAVADVMVGAAFTRDMDQRVLVGFTFSATEKKGGGRRSWPVALDDTAEKYGHAALVPAITGGIGRAAQRLRAAGSSPVSGGR